MTKDYKYKVELWDIKKVIPYKDNAKKHDDKQVNALANNIQKYGLTQPVSIESNGSIIAGHGRTLAMQKLGWDKIPVVVRHDLSEEEAKAVRLSDNRLSSNDYDTELLAKEVSLLAEISASMDLNLIDDLGFEEKELDMFLKDLGELEDIDLGLDFDDQVSKQSEETASSIDDNDAETIKIDKCLGISTVTVSQGRVLKRFMAEIKAEIDSDDGAEALVAHIEGL